MVKAGNKKHGCWSENKRLYAVWCGMRGRCMKPYYNDYAMYGGAGIRVCSEWDDIVKFFAWAKKSNYVNGMSLDRIDNKQGYSPKNCRWVPLASQARNRKSNIKLTYAGATHILTEWAEILEVPRNFFTRRLKAGWSTEEVLTTPRLGWRHVRG